MVQNTINKVKKMCKKIFGTSTETKDNIPKYTKNSKR